MKHTSFLKILSFSILPLLAVTSLRAKTDIPDAQQTVISSDRLEMNNDGKSAIFHFTGNIRLTGTNLVVTCDFLEIQTERNDNPDSSTQKLGSIRSIIATGHVTIGQKGRTATAGKAEVYPNEDKIVLTKRPKVTDNQGNVITGGKLTLFRGIGKILVESDLNNRVRASSSSLPDLGFNEKENDAISTKPRRPSEESSTSTKPEPSSDSSTENQGSTGSSLMEENNGSTTSTPSTKKQ
ncbi:MAG: hypothetical protein JKY51_08395 [Opitutaceae bacterium]|nr:hypothetical protein [Opitutaceae bacterium]